MLRPFLVLALVGSISAPATIAAQVPSRVTWTLAAAPSAGAKASPAAKLDQAKVAAGSTVPVRLTAKIEKGWHIYSITQPAGGPVPTKVTLPTGQPFALQGAIKSSTKPEVKFDENFGVDVEYHKGAVSFLMPVKVDKSAKPGANTLMVNARYQVCSDKLCMPAKTEKLKLTLNVK